MYKLPYATSILDSQNSFCVFPQGPNPSVKAHVKKKQLTDYIPPVHELLAREIILAFSLCLVCSSKVIPKKSWLVRL